MISWLPIKRRRKRKKTRSSCRIARSIITSTKCYKRTPARLIEIGDNGGLASARPTDHRKAHVIQFSIRNPVKVSVGVIIVALFGGIALWQIPMQLTPEVNTPTISVSVRWPGASPYEVEHEIVQPLEEQLKDIKGLTRMTSASSYSNGSVTLEFPVGTEITKAMLELNSRLNQLREFPEDAYEPVISSANLTDRPVCWFVLSPQVPSDDDLAKFVQRHPHLAEFCQPLIEAHKWDLRLYRLNALATEHPELRTLLPVSDVRNMRRFVEEHIEGRFDRVRGVANAFLLGGFEEEMQVITPELFPQTGPMRMGEVVNALSEQTDGHAIVVSDVGQHQMFAARYYQFRQPDSHVSSGGLGTMGFALPAAIGAKMGQPDRKVIAIIGDGGFQMTAQELGTIMQERIGVKVVILNNGYLGMVRQWQELFFDRRYSEVTMENPDFIKLASAYGVHGERVEDRDDLTNAIARMLRDDRPYLLEVCVGAEDNIFPMIPSGASVSEIRLK